MAHLKLSEHTLTVSIDTPEGALPTDEQMETICIAIESALQSLDLNGLKNSIVGAGLKAALASELMGVRFLVTLDDGEGPREL